MAYTAWSVVYGEQPTAAKWNQLGANDAGFKDGTNIDNDAIIERHILNGVVTTKKMKPTYVKRTNGNGTASRQTIGTGIATLAGTEFSYTSGATPELLLITGECISTITSAGSQSFIAVNNVAVGRTTYQDTTTGYFKHTPFAWYEIPANTTVTVSMRYKNVGGTATIANANGDAALAESYGQSIELIAFGR